MVVHGTPGKLAGRSDQGAATILRHAGASLNAASVTVEAGRGSRRPEC